MKTDMNKLNHIFFFNDIPTLKNLKEEFNTLWIKILLKDWLKKKIM